MNEEELQAKILRLEAVNNSMHELIKFIHFHMKGNKQYEHGVVNHPEVPQLSVADYVKSHLS